MDINKEFHVNNQAFNCIESIKIFIIDYNHIIWISSGLEPLYVKINLTYDYMYMYFKLAEYWSN